MALKGLMSLHCSRGDLDRADFCFHHVLLQSTHTENCVVLDLFHVNKDDLVRENGQNVTLSTQAARFCSNAELVKASSSDGNNKICHL